VFDPTAPAKRGLKEIPDPVLRVVIPHLEATFAPQVQVNAVRPEDAPGLSFAAGQQSVIAALRDELQKRSSKG